MKNIKSIYKISALLMTFLILLTACQPKESASASPTPASSSPSESTPLPPSPDTSISISADILLDPAKAADPDSFMVSQYLYEGLVRLDESGNVQPAIAESWIISDDQLDYIFQIRPNAKFSDGTSITADAIVDNFNRWFDPENPLHADGNYPTWLEKFLAFNGERDAAGLAKSLVDGIQKVDQNTVLLHLNRPVPETLEFLAHPAFSILHPDSLSAADYGTKNSLIISSGAYMLSSWTDTGITLEPNPNYWNPVTGTINFVWK